MLPVVRLLVLWIFSIVLIPHIDASKEVIWFSVFLASLLFFFFFYLKFSFSKHLENTLLFIIVLGSVKLLSLNSQNSVDLSGYCNQENNVLLKVKERYKTSDYSHKYIVELRAVKSDSVITIQKDCLLIQKLDTLGEVFYPGDQFWCWGLIPH